MVGVTDLALNMAMSRLISRTRTKRRYAHMKTGARIEPCGAPEISPGW